MVQFTFTAIVCWAVTKLTVWNPHRIFWFVNTLIWSKPKWNEHIFLAFLLYIHSAYTKSRIENWRIISIPCKRWTHVCVCRNIISVHTIRSWRVNPLLSQWGRFFFVSVVLPKELSIAWLKCKQYTDILYDRHVLTQYEFYSILLLKSELCISVYLTFCSRSSSE
jgi:hypothetical protein